MLTRQRALEPIHRLFDEPDGMAKLWRFYAFKYFEDLIKTSSLYFRQAALYQDQCEVTLPKSRRIQFESTVQMIENSSTLHPARQAAEFFKNRFESIRTEVYLSCWHLNEYEPEALWSKYGDPTEGIAICSTLNSIEESMINNSGTVLSCKVRYINFEADDFSNSSRFIPLLDVLSAVGHKRNEFKLDNEVRLIWWSGHDGNRISGEVYKGEGRYIAVDLSKLINKVVISPLADDSYLAKIKGLLSKLELQHIEVVKSKVYQRLGY